MKNEVERFLEEIHDLPDSSIEALLPIIEKEYAELGENDELINQTISEYLDKGYTIRDVIETKESFKRTADEYFKLVSPTSPKGRYISALINVYYKIFDKLIKDGFIHTVKVGVIKNSDVDMPKYAHNDDSGADACASVDMVVPANGTVIVPTGLRFELPSGYEVQVRPRSGLSSKTKTFAIFGTVDTGYRGEIGIIFHNYGEGDYEIKKGDRIAQFVIAPVYHMVFEERKEFAETERGEGGFGSTDEQKN